ncbi:gag protein [Colletotrichum sojae]|uniref:Gag protein n=1 Tax=Colletotrichum sojae TaxID=2175907 RepID=A0A8H6MI92_9PEZI|nr:gag protein [Colletotrichum sojae]
MDQWIYELNTRVGCDPQERRAIANEAYKRVLLAPERKRLGTKKDVEDWLTKWEQAFHEAEASGVPGVELSSLWFPEFIKALSHSYADTWVFSYQATTKKLARSDNLSPGEVLSDAREFLRDTTFSNPRKQIGRGAFGPTTTTPSQRKDTPGPRESNDEEVERSSPPPQLNTRGRGRSGRARGRGRGRATTQQQSYPTRRNPSRKRDEDDEGEGSSECPACFKKHPLAQCWLAFEHTRPDWWFPEESLAKSFEARLKLDKGLEQRIRKVKESENTNN